MNTDSPEPRRPAIREYKTGEIVVRWEPRYCIHSGGCVRALPMVFDRTKRPWIDPSTASADDIARVVTACPSGALHYERLDGGAQEDPDATITITPQPNGPLYVRGSMKVFDDDGRLIREDLRLALCRCGGSHHKPFCDGTHEEIGFRTK